MQNEGVLVLYPIPDDITALLPLRCPLTQSSFSPPQDNLSKAPYRESWLELEIQEHLRCASPRLFRGSLAKSDLLYSPYSGNFHFPGRTDSSLSLGPLPQLQLPPDHASFYPHPDLCQLNAAMLGFCLKGVFLLRLPPE